MLANDRKVISGFSALSKINRFDVETVTATLVSAETVGNRKDWTQGVYLLKAGIVVQGADGKFACASKDDSYGKLADQYNDRFDTGVWSKGAMSKAVQSIAHYATTQGVTLDDLLAGDPWELVETLGTLGAVSAYYTALKGKGQERQQRGPKGSEELFATAVRQAQAEGKSLADCQEIVARLFSGE